VPPFRTDTDKIGERGLTTSHEPHRLAQPDAALGFLQSGLFLIQIMLPSSKVDAAPLHTRHSTGRNSIRLSSPRRYASPGDVEPPEHRARHVEPAAIGHPLK